METFFLIGSLNSLLGSLGLTVFCWNMKKEYESEKVQKWMFENQNKINDPAKYSDENHWYIQLCREVNKDLFLTTYNFITSLALAFACILPFQIKYRFKTYQKAQQKYNDFRSIENKWNEWWNDIINEMRQD